MEILGKTFLITGASRGIGRALSAIVANAGARVLMVSRTQEDLEKAAAGIEGAVATLVGDVSSDEDAGHMVEHAHGLFGGVDVLVNNAAILTDPGPIEEIPPEVWEEVFRVNVIGTANTIRHALPHMRSQGAGVIVNVSSTWGRTAAGRVAPYCASKFAVEGLTQSLADEVPPGVTAVAVNPGVIATDMLARAFEGDVSMYPDPASLGPSWLRFFDALGPDWNGRSLDLVSF